MTVELTTNQKGAVAESQVAAAAIELGIEVYTPILEGGRFDMVFAFRDGELMPGAVQDCLVARRRRGHPLVLLPSHKGRDDQPAVHGR